MAFIPMANGTYDIITVGGGIGGSTLAKAMAEHGARALVLERVPNMMLTSLATGGRRARMALSRVSDKEESCPRFLLFRPPNQHR